MDRGRDSASPCDKAGGFSDISNRHNRTCPKQASKTDRITNLFAGDWNDPDCSCFAVDHSSGHFICDNSRYCIDQPFPADDFVKSGK